jgi:hypothetical protein
LEGCRWSPNFHRKGLEVSCLHGSMTADAIPFHTFFV